MPVNFYALAAQVLIRQAFVTCTQERQRTGDFPSQKFEDDLDATLREEAMCYPTDTIYDQ